MKGCIQQKGILKRTILLYLFSMKTFQVMGETIVKCVVFDGGILLFHLFFCLWSK